MWLWDHELHRLGFRRKSVRYWSCQNRYGLRDGDHVSIFSWSEQSIPAGRSAMRFLVELTEFHVTLPRRGEHLHFYYHEHADKFWKPGGHTSSREIARVGCNRAELRTEADAIALALLEALGVRLAGR